MLWAGFDRNLSPHVFAIENPGKVDFYDKLGFWALGSGQSQALASLFSSHYDRNRPIEECISHVLSAKFSAESTPGVGAKTFIVVYTDDDELLWLEEGVEEEIKEEWKKLPRIPRACLPAIKNSMDNTAAKRRRFLESLSATPMPLASDSSTDQQ